MTVHLFRDKTVQHVSSRTRWCSAFCSPRAGVWPVIPIRDLPKRERTAIEWRCLRKKETGGRATASFFRLEPASLILAALKKGENGNRLVIRFFEAEGFQTSARAHFSGRVAVPREQA
jgi:hypothetical protein